MPSDRDWADLQSAALDAAKYVQTKSGPWAAGCQIGLPAGHEFTLSQTRHRSKSLAVATMVIVPKGEMPYLYQLWNGSIRWPGL
jgi:hypothetical protein